MSLDKSMSLIFMKVDFACAILLMISSSLFISFDGVTHVLYMNNCLSLYSQNPWSLLKYGCQDRFNNMVGIFFNNAVFN